MALFRATPDIERATLKKTVVNTAPVWARTGSHPWTTLPDDDNEDAERHGGRTAANSASSSSTSLTAGGRSTRTPIKPPLPRSLSYAGSTAEPAWSVFSSMSSVSTLSDRLTRKHRDPKVLSAIPTSVAPAPELTRTPHSHSNTQGYPQKLQKILKFNKVGAHSPTSCSCSQYGNPQHSSGPRLSTSSRKRAYKHSLELMRGYPTGQCLSSSNPPPNTTWDERDLEDALLIQERRFTLGKNTAFNIEAVKMFLNSPLFANILKSLTVMTALSLFAMSLSSIIIIQKEVAQGDPTPLSNADTSFIVTLVLSVLTVAYCCFTIFRESRRLPEGLDSSSSKPLIVIFAEIMTSIIWAQVLSVTIYIYIWTFGCTAKGKGQLSRIWGQDEPPAVAARLCSRGGTMVGLEVLLVLLLIFNFYTHLAQNFRFIRAVSR
ncbi:hypothetical protein B0O80DRAFT_496558 [Mortierella sp. GBAus27b]|nr:hypothetical protein B0O80DRAFT_496558 [Mortierella sp. GBAus27b]